MFNELITIAICALSANGALNASNDIAVMNSTDYQMSLVEMQQQHEYDFTPRMEASVPYGQNWRLWVTNEEKPDDIWYFETYVDNETEVHITAADWKQNLETENFYYDFTTNANTTAIQFFNKVSLAGQVYYIKQPDLSNMNGGIGNLLPDGSTANLQNGNSTISIVKLSWDKSQVTKGILGYGRFTINDLTTIASNSTTGRAPDDPSQLNQLMLYYGNYTNKITFTSGYYTRSWSTQGYTDEIQMLSKDYQPYASYASAGNTGLSYTPISTGVTLVALSFEALNSLLGYLVFPGLTLGMLLLVPTFLGIMFAIIKLVKKG